MKHNERNVAITASHWNPHRLNWDYEVIIVFRKEREGGMRDMGDRFLVAAPGTSDIVPEVLCRLLFSVFD